MAIATVPDDLVQPFQIDKSALRGRLVRLGPVVDEILRQHDYPEPVAIMLGEAITLAIILAGALKYEGVFTLQTKGDGPIPLIVADVTTAGAVRGYAQWDAAKLAKAVELHGGAALGSVPKLLGAGYIAFTVDQGEYTDRYQGIVELQGATLAQCAHHYFHQSEQVQAGIKVAVGRTGGNGGGAWRAGGLMIQRVPPEGGTVPRVVAEEREENWRKAMVLMSSSTSAELLDAGLPPNDLLFRLFHEDGVRVYRTHPLRAECRCSRERIERILVQIGPAELAEMKLETGEVTVTCEFCNTTYRFADDEIAALHPPTATGGDLAAGRISP
jgi:molecular chaperone Hsp33